MLGSLLQIFQSVRTEKLFIKVIWRLSLRITASMQGSSQHEATP